MKIMLFHSALGLRTVERDIAAALREDAHDVLVPDLYDGKTATTLEDGLALKDAVGWAAIRARAHNALDGAPADTVLAGVSMGAGVVSEVWPERPAAPAVLLIHGYADIPTHVAAGVRASLHVAVGDTFAPEDTLRRWESAASASRVEAEVHRYAGVGHFFIDPASADYDEVAARAVLQRARTFLRGIS